MKKILLIGIIALSLVEASSEAGTCSSKQRPLPPLQAQPQALIQSITDFLQRKQSLGIANAILTTRYPTDSLVKYLITHRKALINALLTESRTKSLEDYSIINARTPEAHLLASFISYYVVDMSAAKSAARIVAERVFSNLIERAARTESTESIGIESVDERIAENTNWWDAAWDVTRHMVRISDWYRVWNEAHLAVWTIASSHAIMDISQLLIQASYGYLVDQAPVQIRKKAHVLSELYTIAWMINNGTTYRQTAYEVVLSHLPNNLDYNTLLETIAHHTWENAQFQEENDQNPFINSMHEQFDPDRRLQRELILL